MIAHELFEQLLQHKSETLTLGTPRNVTFLKQIVRVHPADSAQFLESLEREDALALFLMLPRELQSRIFDEVAHPLKVELLEALSESERSSFLGVLSIDELTDFFEDLSDAELKSYLRLLHKQNRERVLSLLQFNPESAGGIMYTDVLTLMQDFTVEKSIHILQRLKPSRSLHHKIYVTNQNNELVGHINLEDLVLRSPKTRIGSFVKRDALMVGVTEDRQDVAKKMVHYGVSNVPVVDKDTIFLGVIPSEALVEVIEEEASEDIYRMSALTPSKYSYFDTSFWQLFYQRSSILIMLLMVQTFSSMILRHYEFLLTGFLTYFISMLISTGGNASSQTSALAIQGMATGEIDESSSGKFIRRELTMGCMLALLLSIVSFGRTFIMHYLLGAPFQLHGTIAVSVALALIVVVSILLGSCLPFALKKCGIDPAHSAGPILTTVIDVVGLLIYCIVGGLVMMLLR